MKINAELLSNKKLFRPGESIYIQKSTSLPQYISKLHYHDFIEICYVIQGSSTHIEGGENFIASKGDIFIINVNVPHADYPDQDAAEPYICYDLTFTPDFLDNSLHSSDDFLDINSSFLFQYLSKENWEMQPNYKLKDNSFHEFEHIFKKMLEEYTAQKSGYYEILRAYLIELLIKIFRQLHTEPSKTSGFLNKNEQYINMAVQFIQENYSTQIRLEDIAYRSFLSKSYFSQLFKEVTGLSFSHYLQNVRIEHACYLLANTNDTVSEICERCGFCDLKFFYNLFHKKINTTPAKYRQTHQKDAALQEQ